MSADEGRAANEARTACERALLPQRSSSFCGAGVLLLLLRWMQTRRPCTSPNHAAEHPCHPHTPTWRSVSTPSEAHTALSRRTRRSGTTLLSRSSCATSRSGRRAGAKASLHTQMTGRRRTAKGRLRRALEEGASVSPAGGVIELLEWVCGCVMEHHGHHHHHQRQH